MRAGMEEEIPDHTGVCSVGSGCQSIGFMCHPQRQCIVAHNTYSVAIQIAVHVPMVPTTGLHLPTNLCSRLSVGGATVGED